MKRSRLLAGVMLVVFVLTCCLSMPVLSGEGPWDADDPGNGNGDDNSDPDTTINGEDELESTGDTGGDTYVPAWLWEMLLNSPHPYLIGIAVFTFGQSHDPVVTPGR